MDSIIRFAIIFTIFACGKCKDEENKKNYLLVPIQVRREAPDKVEFQFSKTVQIEPISLEANKVNFKLSEENNMKKFRNTIPLQSGENENINIKMEYFEPQSKERKVQSFKYTIRDQLDEIITVRIEVSLPNARPHTEIQMENNGAEVLSMQMDPTLELVDKVQRKFNQAIDDEFEDSCKYDNIYSEKLLDTALGHSKIGTLLLLTGLEDNSVNPVDAISDIIANKLDLPHLEYNILQAKYVQEGLLFEMHSPRDVIEILNKKDELHLQDLDIKTTTQNFFDLTFDVRSAL